MIKLINWDHCIEAARLCSERMNCTDCCAVNCMGTPTIWGALFVIVFILLATLIFKWVDMLFNNQTMKGGKKEK